MCNKCRLHVSVTKKMSREEDTHGNKLERTYPGDAGREKI